MAGIFDYLNNPLLSEQDRWNAAYGQTASPMGAGVAPQAPQGTAPAADTPWYQNQGLIAGLTQGLNSMRFRPDPGVSRMTNNFMRQNYITTERQRLEQQQQERGNRTAAMFRERGMGDIADIIEANPEMSAPLLNSWLTQQMQPQSQRGVMSGTELGQMGYKGLDPNKAYNVERSPEGLKVSAIGGGGTTVNMNTEPKRFGNIPEGYQVVDDGQGGYQMQPIPGSPAHVDRTGENTEDIATADQLIGLIDKAVEHPGRAAATGLSSLFNPMAFPGSDRTDFLTLADQLKGNAFLQAYQSLKGGGQITEIEGKKAEQAQARLNEAQSEEEYLKALQEMRGLVEDRRNRTPGAMDGWSIERVE